MAECGGCRFWKLIVAGGSFQGQCHRHAPTRNIEIRAEKHSSAPYADALGNTALWPLTRREDGCGDFQRRDDEEEMVG